MKIAAHPERHRVAAEEVRAVLRHAKPLTQQQWAEELQVTLKTVQAWRADGFFLGLWSSPSRERWAVLKADAAKNIRGILSILTVNHRP